MDGDQLSKSLAETLQRSNKVLSSLDAKLNSQPSKKHLRELWPVIISSMVAFATTFTALTYSYLSESRRQALETQKTIVETTRLTIEIFKFTNDSDTETAQVLLDNFFVKVATKDEYDKVRTAFNNLAERKSLSPDQSGKQAFAGYQPPATISESSEIQDLIRRLNEADRLGASKRLVELYSQNKEGVVKSLINAILPAGDPRSYRVNLYVAVTLGNIDPYWEGTETDKSKLEALKSTPNYRNSTFSAWVDKAITNYRQKGPLIGQNPTPNSSLSPMPR